uniref:Seminal fluid protein HACP005 n=1 Tax=Heliconius melpomene TaxID=34740 RepID=D9HQ65_HELME|nr:seminal fluid protein HACP005 [Heliconius melpomene]
MKLVFLVIAIAFLQSSQSQSSNNEKDAENPQNIQFGSDDTPENLKQGNRRRGRHNYLDVDVDVDDDVYVDRDFPYHEGFKSGRPTSSRDRPAGNKGRPSKAKLKEIHILKFPTDPKAVFLYIPLSSSSAVRPSEV